METYKTEDFSCLKGMPGFSDKALETHLKLYGGYVENINKLNGILIEMEKNEKFKTPEYAELNRRFGWEWNGMRLHEYYFGSLSASPTGIDKAGRLYQKISENFGSFEDWEKDFRVMGMMRGIGWVILYFDKPANKLFNVWINEHDTGHFAGAVPLLVMDVFEHAFLIDYGTGKADYIEAFMKNIDWIKVESRLE